jgi:hypothetical protein
MSLIAPIIPKHIPLNVYILDRAWNAKRIKFPFTLKTGTVLNIYTIDKIADVLTKIYIITGQPPPLLHIRGLKIEYDEWIAAQKPDSVAFISAEAKEFAKKTSAATAASAAATAASAAATNSTAPAYKQLQYTAEERSKHLGYISQNTIGIDNMWPSISFRAAKLTTDLPIHAATSPYITIIRDMPADNQYLMLHDLEYSADDRFITEFAPSGDIVIIPFDTFLKPKTISCMAIMNDVLTFDRIYFGFVRKYYPLLNETAFKVYLNNAFASYLSTAKIKHFEQLAAIEEIIMKKMISTKYKSLAPDEIMSDFRTMILRADFNVKSSLTIFGGGDGGSHSGNNTKKSSAKSAKSTSAAAAANVYRPHYILRNIFDKTHVTDRANNIGYMRLEIAVTNSGLRKSNMVVQKYRIGEYIGRITNVLKVPGALMFAIIAPKGATTGKMPQYMYITESGDISFKTYWPEIAEMELDDIMNNISERIHPAIAEINRNIMYYGTTKLPAAPDLSPLTMDIVLIWSRELSARDFRVIREQFREYIETGFAEYISSVIFEVKWMRSMQTPCTIRFVHKTTHIRIEISNIYLNDYNLLLPFIYVYLNSAHAEVKRQNRAHAESKSASAANGDDDFGERELKRIKKLRENDSILYDNLKPGMIYSKKCQGIRQPNYITEHEYKLLGREDRANIITYWNFTYDKPAHYTCQNDSRGKPLTFSFLTNIHESDYCVPCCKQKPIAPKSKQSRRDEICTATRSCPPNVAARSPSKSAYVIVTNRELPQDRIGALPDDVSDIIGKNMFAYGIVQNIPSLPDSHAQIVYAIAHALNMTVEKYIGEIIKNIRAQISTHVSIGAKTSIKLESAGGANNSVSQSAHEIFGGLSSEYVNSLVNALQQIFINKIEFYTYPMSNWIEFFIFQTLEIFNMNIVVFRIKTGELILLENTLPKILIVEYTFVETQYNTNLTSIAYYPIYKINPREFYSNLAKHDQSVAIQLKTFAEPIPKLDSTQQQTDVLILSDIVRKFGVESVAQLYVNINNKCYAILFRPQSQSISAPVYLPIGYSNIYPRIPINYDSFDSAATKFTPADVKAALDALALTPTSAIKYETRIIALVVLGLHMYMSFEAADILPLFSADLPITIAPINYIDVNHAIANAREVPKELRSAINRGHYRNNIYDLIKIELLNIIDSRGITLAKLREMTIDELCDLIPHTIRENSELTSNIILPCGANPDSKHCVSSTLIVPPEYREFIEILKEEIDDTFINFITESRRNIIMNMLDFEQAPGERIIITQSD